MISFSTPLAIDLHYGILRGVGWASGEVGGNVVYGNAAATAGSSVLSIPGAKPIPDQLLAYLGVDGRYRSIAVVAVSGNNVTLRSPIDADITASSVFNFYDNQYHPNRYGYCAIADFLVDTATRSLRQVARLAPAVFGSSAIVSSPTVNPFNPGGATAPAYAVTPATVGAGCSWTFTPSKTGPFRVKVKVNAIAGTDLYLRISIGGISYYQKSMIAQDCVAQELSFFGTVGCPVEIRLVRSTGAVVFITSDLVVFEELEHQHRLEDAGVHALFGDSWVQQNSVSSPAYYGIIDRLRARLPSATFVDLGVGGNTSAALYGRMSQLDAVANLANVYVIAGTNDYASGLLPATVSTYNGAIQSHVLALGANPIVLTSPVGSVASPAEFNLSRKYQVDIPYWG